MEVASISGSCAMKGGLKCILFQSGKGEGFHTDIRIAVFISSDYLAVCPEECSGILTCALVW